MARARSSWKGNRPMTDVQERPTTRRIPAPSQNQESKGEGVIYTFSVMRRNTPVPYAIGYVTLDEGPSLLTNFIDCDFDSLKIGQRVKLKWTPTGEGQPPVFTFTPA